MAAVVAVAIHGLLLVTKPPWRATLPGMRTDKPISLELQFLSPTEPEEEASIPNDITPEPLPEPPAQLEPEPPSEPPSKPEPVPKPIPEKEFISKVEPEPDPVPRPEPEQEFVSKQEPDPEPDPAEKPKKVHPFDKPEKAENTASDIFPEEVAKSPRKRVTKTEKTKLPDFDGTNAEKVEKTRGVSRAEEKQRVSAPSTISDPIAPAIIEAKPKYLENDPPKYPRVARRRGYSGTVVVEVLVSASGRAEEVQLFSSSGHGILDKAALSAVSEWRFDPGTKNGIPVSTRVKVPVRFRLE